MRPAALIAFLGVSRGLGALVNIVHDCDEVFNYWEPLHYLVHGTGMQTWEYSSKYALRPYLYILLHWPVAKAFSMVAGTSAAELYGFYGTRAVLSLASLVLEARLIKAVHATCGTIASTYTAVFLATCAGTFFAPSTLLPSTFAMMCMTSATTATLSGVAFLPLALLVLLSPRLARSFVLLIVLCAALLAAVAASDQYFYGRPTVSLVNFIQYNVIGGGESSLYGVEAWPFYLINGALNFGVALPAALLLAPVAMLGAMDITSARVTTSTAWAVSPLYVWLAAISALPHKEERFLYVVYPQICLAAGITLSILPRLITDLAQAVFGKVRSSAARRSTLRNMTSLAVLVSILASSLFSASRIYGMLMNYSAPMYTWAQLSKAHRALQARELSGVASGSMHGLLPKAFEKDGSGTHAAPQELNDRNVADARLVLPSTDTCTFWVGTSDESTGLDQAGWSLWSQFSFVHHSQSPFPYRSFWVPGSRKHNTVVAYQLHMRTERALTLTVEAQ